MFSVQTVRSKGPDILMENTLDHIYYKHLCSETHDSRQESSESEGTNGNRNPKITLQFYRSAHFNCLVSNTQPSSLGQLWNLHNSTLSDLGVILGESNGIPPADVKGEKATRTPAAVCHCWEG